MRRTGIVLFVAAVVSMTGVTTGQDAKDTPKAKGFLPMNWKELGLTDEQKQKVYTIQNKYNDQIDKLESQIKELKSKMAKDRLEVLTQEQSKKLEDIMKSKAGK